MRFSVFLCTRFFAICALLAADGFVCLMMVVLGCSFPAVALAFSVLLTGMVAALLLEYERSKRFYREIAQLSEQVEHPYQMTSLMKKPSWADQRRVFNALLAMGNVSANEVARAQAAQNEQREYMERWVHEAKAPLAASLLVAARVPEPEQGQLKNEIERSLYEVDQVLWYARSLCAQADYRIRKVNLAVLTRDVCKQHARLLIERGVAPQLCVPENTVVLTDEKQAAFIVTQVVVNAAKYGATRILFSVEERADDVGAHQVVLCIADNGWGIPEADLPRVFDRGFTGTRGRQVGSSTGMGLYLAATLCKKLGLGLSIASQEGEGTVAKIAFPLDTRRADAAAS